MSPKSKFVSLFLSFALLATQITLPVFANVTEPNAKFDTITGSVSGKVVLGEAGKKFSQSESTLRPPVAGVRVRLTNLETGTDRTILTDAKGEYRFPLVPMGNYKVEVFKEGYYLVNEDEISQKAVTVKLNDLTKYLPDAQMVQGVKPPPAIVATQTTPKPTPTPQTAPVAKEAYAGQLANLTDSTRRSNADEQMVALLPLSNIRSFDDLATLAAGVSPPPQVKGVAGPGIGSGIGTAGQFSVNGARARSNNFTVDGSDNNDEDVGVRRQGFVALVPQSVESVKEIQIVTHLWDAEHGRSVGSQVNAVSKSGTNQVHGSVYDFFNHSSLNARNFFDYSGKNAQPYRLDALAISNFVNGQPTNTRRLPVRVDGQEVVLPNPSQDKDQFQRNQGGGTIGFPILKERTFFFGSFEHQDIKARQETHFAVPTIAQRGVLGFGATGFKATDRFNRRQTFFPTFVAGDSVMSLFPFPNNPVGPYGENTYTQVLPADASATIYSLKLDHNFNLFSEATHAFTARYNFTDDEKQVPTVGGAIFSGVIPSVRTQNLSLFLSSQFSGSRANQLRASFGRTALTFAELRDSYLQPSRLLPQEPYLLNARRLQNLSSPPEDGQPPPQFVSYARSSAAFTTEGNLGPIGQLVVSPFSPLGLDVYLFPQARANNTIQVADTLSWFRAEHSYKFGFDIRRTQLNSFLNRNYRPQVVFGGSPDLTRLFDQAPLQNISQFGPTPGYFSGADLASLGIPTGIFQSLAIGEPNSAIGLRFWQLNFFANENWRARRGLTLDYGLRYELNTVPREVNSRIESTFALNNLPTADNSLRLRAGFSNQALSNQDLLNSYTATINSLRQTFNGRNSIFDPDRNNFGGHVGFAWDPMAASQNQAGKTVIRGGIGAYYDLTLGSVVSQSRNVFPNFLPFNADAGSFAYFQQLFFQPGESGTLAIYNPSFIPIDVVSPNGNFTRFPLIQSGKLNAIQLPSGVLPQVLGLLLNPANTNPVSNGVRLPSGGGLAYTLPDGNLRSPYTFQYNLQIERELLSDFLLNVAYVGTRGVKLTRFRTPNGGPNSITLPIDPLGLNANSIQAIALPPLSNIAAGRLQRPNPNLGAFTVFDSSAASTYHSLQTTVTKRFSRGYQLTAAYTWSHAIDDVSDVFDVAGAFVLPQDDRALQLERGSANFDVRHRFALSTIGNFPFIDRFNGAKGAKGVVLGGWQFASLTTYQTGQPFTVNTGLDVNMDGNLTDRLHTLNGLTVLDDRRVKLRLGTTSVNLLAPLGANGGIGRNTFRASGIARTDMAVIKNIQLGGSHFIVFRAEAFNLWNRTHFGVPVRILEAPSFGQSVDTQIGPRQVQFALKYVF